MHVYMLCIYKNKYSLRAEKFASGKPALKVILPDFVEKIIFPALLKF